ncbi:hypothetical protein HDU81_009388 [Chytriomyces hyalinus]|nr:hypothetical protein HDU81_009388 [Chytriomyces hyalinus]
MTSSTTKITSILAIDVSIKNLGVCCLALQNGKLDVCLWKVINVLLCGQDEQKQPPPATCTAIKKNGVQCSKPARSGNDACGIHGPKLDQEPPKKKQKKKKKDGGLVRNVSMQSLALHILQTLDALFNDTECVRSVSAIAIELQPKVNAKMNFVSHIIFAKLVDLFGKYVTVQFVHAVQKLTHYSGPVLVAPTCKKGAYAQRK